MKTTKKAEENLQQALAAFITSVNHVSRLARDISEIADDHFNLDPDSINWANVGDVANIEKTLRDLLDRINKTGEYAS